MVAACVMITACSDAVLVVALMMLLNSGLPFIRYTKPRRSPVCPVKLPLGTVWSVHISVTDFSRVSGGMSRVPVTMLW